MSFIMHLFGYAFQQVLHTVSANWPFLLVSIVVSAGIKLYADQDRVAGFLQKNRKGGVLISTLIAVTTPLCSCGTTAVVLGMMASVMPWAPIIAFMVSSPLTSPEELIYSAGLFGWPFAIAFFVASIILGLLGGAVAGAFESRGWLKGQARMAQPGAAHASLSLGIMGAPAPLDLPVITRTAAPAKPAITLRTFGMEMVDVSKRLIPLFLGFAFVGYLLNGLIPAAWITSLFGAGHAYSVPLAATLGIPFYINTEASLPLVRAMLDSGMSQGAALSFLITGAGTSLGALGGALTIARWRVIGIILATLWTGAILLGIAYDLLLI
jgi:uncharacterized membrane protein YraQ (UPF0718 family)